MTDLNERLKQDKIKEIEFSKVRAVVEISMKASAFSSYAINAYKYYPKHSLYKSRLLVATLSIELKKTFRLHIALDAIGNDISGSIVKIGDLCQSIKRVYNATAKEKNELAIRRFCNKILLPFGFPIWYELYYEEKKEPCSLFSADDMEYIGGGYNISRHLVTQEEFMSVIAQNFSFFPCDTDPIDNVDYISALRYCNILSRLEDREPFYALNGEVDATKWDDMILCDEGTAFYCNPKADGFRLPRAIELHYLKDRNPLISEYLAEFDSDKDFFYPTCSFAKDVSEKRIRVDEEGESGMCFRVAYKN